MKKKALGLLLMTTRYVLIGFLFQFFSFNLLFGLDVQAQMNKEIHADLSNRTVGELFTLIEKETAFNFVYDSRKVDVGQRLTIRGRDNSVKAIFDKMSEELYLAFKVIDNTVTVAYRAPSRSIKAINKLTFPPRKALPAVESLKLVLQRQSKLSGRVTDRESGAPLPGVNVVVQGTQNGTSTDEEGRYELTNVTSDAVLEFSFIGYLSQEIAVNNRSRIVVQLQEDLAELEKVVVVGYGEQKKVNLTGAITSIGTDDIDEVPMANLSNGLAGKAPGVQVVGTSGLSGAGASIRIRGSFGEPLYVINGIIRDKAAFDALNPNEVENISFLKDAASASIYGSSAGNGVVLVTTKGGSAQEATFEYKGNYSSSRPTHPLQSYSAQDELRFANNVAITKGQEAPYGPEVMDYFADKSYGINDLIWQNPSVQEHNLSVRGGSEAINYYLLLGYHTEEGSYKNLGYDRYNFRSDITAKVSDRLTVNVNLSGNQRNYNRWYWPYDGAEDFNVSDFYRTTFNWTRLYPFYVDEEGNPTNDPNDLPVKPAGAWHPVELMLNDGGYRDTRYRTLDGILRLDLDLGQFVEGLSTSAQGSINAYDRNMKSFVVHNDFYIFQSASATNKFIPGPVDLSQKGSHNLSSGYENIQENVNLSSAYQFNWFLNYDRSFGKHAISALAVYEQAGSNSKAISGRAEGLLSSAIDQIYNASGDTERRWFNGSEGEFARASWIGRANYTFADKYIAEFSFRYDGNYKFAPGRRWGFFPSGSAAWRISEEPFMQNAWLDNLKLRASYGTTGSDNQIVAWRWGQVYQKTGGYIFGNTLNDGLTPGAVPNPDITWSTVSLWDIGLEFGFLNGRLAGEFDVWGKRESDILGTRLGSTPTTYGASLPAVNYAERSWQGVELVLNWRDQVGEVNYSIYGNMGYARDQWDIYDEPESLTDGTYAGNWRSRIGKPQNRIQGYISKGIIRTQEQLDALPEGFTQFGREPMLGVLLFEDIRGANYSEGPDGKIDANDMTYLSDNGAPRINYGLGFRAEWRGISINAHFQGVGAYDRMISTLNGGGVFQVDRPYFDIWAGDYWTPENPDAAYPRVSGAWMQPEYGGGASTFWMRNGTYLRLKHLNIGYTLPEKWFSAVGIQNVQLYGNATNLFVISGFREHDPEQARLDSYPLMKTFTGGLTVQF